MLLMVSTDVCLKHHSPTSRMIRSYLGSLVFGEEVQGKNCFTNFHELDMTTDKLRSLVKKWQKLIEAAVQVAVHVETIDSYGCVGPLIRGSGRDGTESLDVVKWWSLLVTGCSS